jgi:hypothetical protein
MPTAVVRGLEHDQLHEHQRHTNFTPSLSQASSQASSSNAASSSVHDDDVVVDIERDRRFGSFSRNERGISDESSSGGMDEIARRLSRDTASESGSKNHDGEETWDDKEDDDGLVVCEPPSVGWSDVSSWLVENSCVTVDLRNCDETQHPWVVQRYDPGSNNGGVVIGSDDSSSRSRQRKKTNRKNMCGVSRKRTSFLHVPFIPTDLAAATLLVTRLIVLLRKWGAGSGYVVLVTWKDEQSNAVVSVASALMRAAIPRVCSFPMDRRFQVQGGSLAKGSTPPPVSPRTQRRFQRNIRRSLNGTQGPNVF